jgi:hypothetical protein
MKSSISSPRRSPSQIALGGLLLTIGILGLAVTYVLRPPSNGLEALQMILSGKQHYINQPLYTRFLAGTGGLAIVGALVLLRTPPKPSTQKHVSSAA